jgi:hypothetical protein
MVDVHTNWKAKNPSRKFTDLQTMIRDEWGSEAFEALKGSLEGYQGLYTSSYDFPKLIEENAEDGSGVYFRPLGGMIEVLEALRGELEPFEANGRVKLFLNSEIVEMTDADSSGSEQSISDTSDSSSQTVFKTSGSLYKLTLSNFKTVVTPTPIFAIAPLHLSQISGKIPKILTKAPSP